MNIYDIAKKYSEKRGGSCKFMKIVFTHEALRNYRLELFESLAKNYNIKFFFFDPEWWNNTDVNLSKFRGRYEIIPSIKFRISPLLFFKLKTQNPDIIIASTFHCFSTYVDFFYAKLFRKKLIIITEEWGEKRTLFENILSKIAKFIVCKSDAVIAFSTQASKYALKLGAKKIFVGLNYSIDLSKVDYNEEFYQQLKKKYVGKKIILYLSRIVRYKGLDVLIKAFSQLQKKHPNYWLIIGGEGDFRGYCEKLSQQLNLQNIEFLGRVPQKELVLYFKLCDLYVLPSRFVRDFRSPNEAWGIVIGEALSLGKPVISTTAVAAAYDLIQNGKNGFQVRENDAKALAIAIEKILESHNEFQIDSHEVFNKANAVKQMKAFDEALKFMSQKSP